MGENEMENWQDLDPAAEAEGRRLLTAAFETSPVGPVPGRIAQADDEWAVAERLRRQVRRRISRRRRVRTLVPAGAVAALGGAVVLALTLAATVASAPSALAAVTAAAAKTSATSFSVTSTLTRATSSGEYGPPVRVTGVFDPGRGLGEETVTGTKDPSIQIRIADKHVYLKIPASWSPYTRDGWADGKPWIESPLPPTPFDPSPGRGFAGAEPIDPSALLGMLRSAASVQAEGPASGPGWTGTKYALTEPSPKGTALFASGTVYVDNQGRVRRIVTTETAPVWLSTHWVTGTDTLDVTFGGFGVRVSATAPPASQVYHLGNGQYVSVDVDSPIGVVGIMEMSRPVTR